MNQIERLMRREKGGGGGSQPAPTVISTPPPPTTTSVEVQQARRQARVDAAKRKGLSQTTFAGETGGYKPATLLGNTPAMGTEKKTVLG